MRVVEARSDILDEASRWMIENPWMSGETFRSATRRHSRPRRARPRIVICLLLLLATPRESSAQSAPTADLSGYWRFQQTGEILEFFTCGERRCARIAALAPGETQTRDLRNPSESLKSRRLCGLTVISRLRPGGEQQWRRGDAYRPEDGHTYDVRIDFLSSEQAVLRAAIRGFPLLGSSYTLERVAQPDACQSRG